MGDYLTVFTWKLSDHFHCWQVEEISVKIETKSSCRKLFMFYFSCKNIWSVKFITYLWIELNYITLSLKKNNTDEKVDWFSMANVKIFKNLMVWNTIVYSSVH